jgi:hypothetical protein
MPQQRKSSTAAPASPASKLFRRRVRFGGGAGYNVRRPGPDGSVVQTVEHANRGEEIVVDAIEALRLDSLGALAAPGATAADIKAESDARIAQYRAERSSVRNAA